MIPFALCSEQAGMLLCIRSRPNSAEIFPIPVPLLRLFYLLALAYAVGAVLLVQRKRRGVPPQSIKESFDNLPIAICFFDAQGIIQLVNRQMLRHSATLIGSELQTLSELQEALAHPRQAVTRLDTELYRFPDGRILRFSQAAVTDRNGNRLTEVIATDVSELYARQAKLREENERLSEANRRAKQLYDNMEQLVREEEILTLKMRIHDDIGHSILSARRALLYSEDLEAIQSNAAVWESSIALLYRANSMPQPPDALEYAKARAKALGAQILLKGQLPEDRELRYLFTLAIRECVSNCVRHASGTRVLVVASQADAGCAVTITNDGAAPQSEITEGGGLSALRRRIEHAGGQMQLQSLPVFKLTIFLPWREDVP